MPDWTLTIDLAPIEAAAQRAAEPDMDLLSAGIQRAAAYVRDVWARAVTGELLPGMTRPIINEEYHDSLHTGQSLRMLTPLHGAVVSTYPHIDRIENGYPAFDMKPGLLAGPASRPTADGGRYAVVPFRHMTPDRGTGDMQHQRRAHGAVMPAEVYKIVKKSGGFIDPGDPRRGEQLGQRSKLAAAINLEALARGLPAPMAGNYTWRAGQFTGMRKMVKTYGSGRQQSTYWTFRAVSANSDPDSWIHPGMAANPLIAAVLSASQSQVEEIVMAAARAAYGLE